jgi:hypothetical protein
MSAGLPGLGLGGIFFILTALLLAPAVEISRTLRGQSSLGAWRMVGRQFAMALGMVAAIELTLRGAALLPGVSASGAAEGLSGPAFQPIAISIGALLALLLAAKLVGLFLRPRPRSPITQRVYRAGRRLVFERGGP